MMKAELDHRQYLKVKGTSEYKARNVRSMQKWKSSHPGWRKPEWKSNGNGAAVKVEVLTHYGPEGRLQCSWPGCEVTDVDMLSLDHINNDGAAERRFEGRGGGGITTYRRVRRRGFPEGYQTLCHNHQWKKELMRRRDVGTALSAMQSQVAEETSA